MARLPRICLPGITQHVIQRGNNRQACFASEDDFAAYAYWLEKFSRQYHVAIHAWVFMTNHVHLLMTPETRDGISKLMQTLGRQYVRYFNHTYKRTGTLWEGRFKSCVVDAEDYVLICQRYIELNPVRAGMVVAPGDYKWSSFKANGLAKKMELWQPHFVYNSLGATPQARADAYRTLFSSALDSSVLEQIRQASNKGMALGNDKFKQQIQLLSGRRVMSQKPGPRPKNEKEFLL